MRLQKDSQAWTSLRESAAAGGRFSGIEEEELDKHGKLSVLDRMICPSKLEHDIQQIDYLLSAHRASSASAATELEQRRAVYASALKWLESRRTPSKRGDWEHPHLVGCTALKYLPQRLHDDVASSYNEDMLPVVQPPQSGGPVLRQVDWSQIQKQFWEQGYAVLDQVLTDEYYEHVLQFSTESSCFTRMDFPYIGCYLPRVATPVIGNLTEELAASMPKVFNHNPLLMLSIYKHLRPRVVEQHRKPKWKLSYSEDGQPQSGSTTHNDFATVNVNFMISAEGAKMRGGGLEIFLCDPVGNQTDVDIEDSSVMDALVLQCPHVTIEYKPNRAIIFASSLFHKTEPFEFRKGYENSRAFMTFLYGENKSPSEHIATAPEDARVKFAAEIARKPPGGGGPTESDTGIWGKSIGDDNSNDEDDGSNDEDDRSNDEDDL